MIGHLAYRFAGRRRHIAATNLRMCFPDQEDSEREPLLKAHFQSLGLGIMETAASWWTPEHRLRGLATIEGREHLEAALAGGKGVILLSAHFTSLEIGGRLLAMEIPFHVLYRQHRNPVFERIMRRAREKHFHKAIPRRDMRAMIRSLRENMPVWYAPDQDYGRKHSVFSPFFGVPAATLTTTARLSGATGAAVIPFYQQRTDQGYRLILLPPLAPFPSGDEAGDTATVNGVIEDMIREQAADYLWVHRRFKTRPDGEHPVY